MHASLLRLGLVPLPRVECSIEEKIVLLCTMMGAATSATTIAEGDVESADEGTRSAFATGDEGEGEGAIKVCTCVRCLLYTSPSPRDATLSRMPSSA